MTLTRTIKTASEQPLSVQRLLYAMVARDTTLSRLERILERSSGYLRGDVAALSAFWGLPENMVRYLQMQIMIKQYLGSVYVEYE